MKHKLNPKVSIIITTKNEARIIEKLLKSLQRQIYKNIEIILVDNNSSDNTLEIAKKFKISIFTFGPERSAQRNYGAKNATGEFLFFLDADMELAPKSVQSCVNIARKEGTYGVVVPEQSIATNFWGEVKAFERSFYSITGDPVTEAARFFSKIVFLRIGGYDESITGPEDWDLPDRIREKGYKIGRCNEKIYHHEQEVSLIKLFTKKFYYGLNAHKYLSKHKISLVSPKTVYFLRPLYYKNWRKLFKQPILSIAMIVMLSVQTLGGGLGYLIGRLRK